MPDVVKIVSIGASTMGRLHAEALASIPEARLVGVVDRNFDAAREFADAFGIGRLEKPLSIEDALQLADAVIISTPTGEHPHFLTRALEARLPTFVEEPVALKCAVTSRFVRDFAQRRVPLQVGHSEAYDDAFQRALATARQITSLRQVSVHTTDEPPGRENFIRSPQVFFHEMVLNDLHMAGLLAGEPITKLTGFGGTKTEISRDFNALDWATILFKTAGGHTGVIESKYRSGMGFHSEQEIEGEFISGTSTDSAAAQYSVEEAGGGTFRQPAHQSWRGRYEKAFETEMRTFAALASRELGAHDFYVDGRQAEQAQRALDAVEIVLSGEPSWVHVIAA